MGAVFAFGFLLAGFGWLVMLVMGALHHEVSTDIPAASYTGSLMISYALYLVYFIQATFIGAAILGVVNSTKEEGSKDEA